MEVQKSWHDESDPMLRDLETIHVGEVDSHIPSHVVRHYQAKTRFQHTVLRPFQYCCILILAIYAASWSIHHVSSLVRVPREFSVDAGSHKNVMFGVETFESICMKSHSEPSKKLQSTAKQQAIANHAGEVFSKDYQFDFDVLTDNLTASTWALLDSATPISNNTLQGEVTVDRGNASQASDIEVHVTVHSNSIMGVAAVELKKQDNALAIEFSRSKLPEDLWTQVQVTVLLRPRQEFVLDELNLQTNMLNLNLNPFLKWEVNQLVINSTHGNLTILNNIYEDPLVAHNMSVSLIHGWIYGCFIPDKNLEINMEYGLTQLNLAPNLSPEAPAFEPESITITSQSEIQAVAGYWLWPSKPYYHRTKIETATGMLAGIFMHGSHTNLTCDGTMEATVFTFNTDSPDSQSEIYTNSQHSPTILQVIRAFWDLSGGEYNPLENTYSEHLVDVGWLSLAYDSDWAGVMDATVERGELEMNESQWDIIESREGFRKASRGENGSSHLHAYVKYWGMGIRLE